MIKSKKFLQNIVPYSIDAHYQNYKYKLDSNENPYGASPAVIGAIRNFDPAKVSTYPAYGALIEKLATFWGAEPVNFVLTNGCDEAISVVLNTFLKEGDKVLSYGPTFSMPKLYTECLGGKFIEIDYCEKFAFNYDKFVQNIQDDVKILYLTSPNNPTGEIISLDIVQKLLNSNKDKLVVLDCTYFNYSNVVQKEYFELVRKFDNLIVVKSFSKDYALAGLRLGYIFSNSQIINETKKVISPYSVNAVALFAGIEALCDRVYLRGVVDKINSSKKKFINALEEFGYKVYSTEANFVLVDCGNYADFLYQKLLNNGVKVKYFKNIPALKNTFRVTVPKLEDVDFIIELFKPRRLFVFDMDGVIFDVSNSYREAIKKTVFYYTKREIQDTEIQNVKNMGGMSNDWDVSYYLINQAGFSPDYNEMVDVFQDFFFIKGRDNAGLIDREVCVLNEEFFEKLTKHADCALFTARPRDEAFYSLKKDKLEKYFSYCVCNEDLEGHHKPSPFGLNKIKASCCYVDICYFGDTVDDIKAGVDANVAVYGIIPPNAKAVDETVTKLKEFGANGVITSSKGILELISEGVYAND